MKKTLILALALATGVAGASPYYLPTGRYTDDLPGRRPVTPAPVYAAEAAVANPFGIEIAGTYTHIFNDAGYDESIDTWGADATISYNIDSNWSVNLRLGWATASESETYMEYDKWDYRLNNWTIAPGVRYTTELDGNLSFFIGANIGIGIVDATTTWTDTYTEHGHQIEREKWTSNATGFVYSVDLGLRYNLSENFYMFGAIHIWGTSAAPVDTETQHGAGLRIGMGLSF